VSFLRDIIPSCNPSSLHLNEKLNIAARR
jgi:hypothetical protein